MLVVPSARVHDGGREGARKQRGTEIGKAG